MNAMGKIIPRCSCRRRKKGLVVIDFTYTVFLVVASVIGSLVTVFAVGIIGLLLYDSNGHRHVEEPAELPRAA